MTQVMAAFVNFRGLSGLLVKGFWSFWTKTQNGCRNKNCDKNWKKYCGNVKLGVDVSISLVFVCCVCHRWYVRCHIFSTSFTTDKTIHLGKFFATSRPHEGGSNWLAKYWATPPFIQIKTYTALAFTYWLRVHILPLTFDKPHPVDSPLWRGPSRGTSLFEGLNLAAPKKRHVRSWRIGRIDSKKHGEKACW